MVQQHAASFVAHTEASTGAELPQFVKDEFDAFLECGILALLVSVTSWVGGWAARALA
ncbi:hypothetical protein ACPOLB_26920 [Rubrivivax sp. RP6-9]|uniref:hypothetical protein n=1 Tax=Rubrivivax sp. RP6-9 TaxID=3415750 RepID=UPI003CC62CEE